MARVIKNGARVVPRALAEAKAEAGATRAAARLEAEAIVRQARDEAHGIEDAAAARGREAARSQAASLMLEAARTKDALLANAHDDLVEVALSAAQKIVEAHVAVGGAEVATLVKGALDRARRATRIVLTLHPLDAASLRAVEGELALPPSVAIESDASLSRGDCIVKSELGQIDARVETKLEALRAALLGGR